MQDCDIKSFDEQGLEYQEMVCRALFEDQQYAETISDVINSEYFSFAHLKAVSKALFDYRKEFKAWPSASVIMMQLESRYREDEAMLTLLRAFDRKLKNPLKGDRGWIEQSSLEFCRRQNLLSALGQCLDMVEGKRYDSIASTVRKALDQGSVIDNGHDHNSSLDVRTARSDRDPISTGWPVLDALLNGGYERGTITTFIAPTGAGKSMFLVNAACALVHQGLNVLYVTLEMADWKIGLRADSWFSEIAIDDIKNNQEHVAAAIKEKAKGRFFIKEWPTKRATVETIRSFIQRILREHGVKFDAMIVDYPDLLKPSKGYGEKRHELEGNYEDLRGLSQEENLIMLVADQTNRGGLDAELVTIASVAESYNKMTVCDVILTVSRSPEMKMSGTGNLFLAKSRLGQDGIVLPFLLDTKKNVKITVLDNKMDNITTMMKTTSPSEINTMMKDRLAQFKKKPIDRMSNVEGDI